MPVYIRPDVFAQQGDMGFPGSPGGPGLDGFTGRKVNIQMCTHFSFALSKSYTNTLFSSLQGDKGVGGINGADGVQGVKGEKVCKLSSVTLALG